MSKTLGKLREYETVLIINPDLTPDAANELIERFKKIISDKGGEFLREERWDKRKMAFEMKKNPRGHYIFLHYVGGKAVVDEIQRTSHNVEQVIRHMTSLLGSVTDVEAKKAEVEKMVREREERARLEAERKKAEAENAEAAAEAEA